MCVTRDNFREIVTFQRRYPRCEFKLVPRIDGAPALKSDSPAASTPLKSAQETDQEEEENNETEPNSGKLLMFQLMVVAKNKQIHQLHNQRRNDQNQLRKQLPNRQFLQLNHLRENLQFQQPEKLHPCQNCAILVQLQRFIEIIWIIWRKTACLSCLAPYPGNNYFTELFSIALPTKETTMF